MLFYSVRVLPIGLSQTIQNLTPFLTLIFAFLLLRETLKKLEIYNMVAAFSGVLITVGFSSLPASKISYSSWEFFFALILNASSTVMTSLVNVIIRSLKGIHFSVAGGFQAACTFLASLLVLLFYRLFVNTDYDYSTLTLSDWGLLALNGTIMALMQLLWIKALFLDKAGRAASLTFLSIVMGYVADRLFFGYQMQWHEYTGAAIIVVCSAIVIGLKLVNYSD
jgi:drug/metabolite transporter (DMT)-like permease